MAGLDGLKKLAYVQKSFSSDGHLVIKFSADAPQEIDLEEPVVVFIDGLQVPFFFEDLQMRGSSDKAVVMFENIETAARAQELIGKDIYYRTSYNESQEYGEDDLEAVAQSVCGFSFTDSTTGREGTVTGWEDIPGNPCLCLESDGEELLIPLCEEFMGEVDYNKKTLQIISPQGLFS